MIDVLIHSPFPQETGQGNAMTADRTELILRAAGFDVQVEAETYQGADARCLVALNAWRSAGVVAEFDRQNRGRQVVVVVTGSDINHPEMEDEGSETRQTMERADALVTLHEADLKVLPERLQHKAVCIFPSVRLAAGITHLAASGDRFEVVMAGNLRAVKNPQLAVEVGALLPGDSPIFINSYGDASDQLAAEMTHASAEVEHFNWCGKLAHATLIEKMARAHVLLNTSTVEGGANAICEAVTMGLPVIASDIRGNVGMLGENYLGLFPNGDAQAAVGLLQRCITELSFYQELKKQVAQRAPLFDFATESSTWLDLIRSRLAH
ncbi:glycosyltransferase family 4 protein [Akkermansiaceae bacterium]|nr:glycosyltransferase family 4 protein [Akkermansiaceae bacterium]